MIPIVRFFRHLDEMLHIIEQRIRHVGESLSAQIDAATADLKSDLATITTGVTNLEAELAAAVSTVTPGSTVTQDQVDALKAVHTALATLAASIPAPPAPPAPAP